MLKLYELILVLGLLPFLKPVLHHSFEGSLRRKGLRNLILMEKLMEPLISDKRGFCRTLFDLFQSKTPLISGFEPLGNGFLSLLPSPAPWRNMCNYTLIMVSSNGQSNNFGLTVENCGLTVVGTCVICQVVLL